MHRDELTDDVLGARIEEKVWCRDCMVEVMAEVAKGEAQLLMPETIETMEREGMVIRCTDCGAPLTDLEP
jgi:hypothetical protein